MSHIFLLKWLAVTVCAWVCVHIHLPTFLSLFGVDMLFFIRSSVI